MGGHGKMLAVDARNFEAEVLKSGLPVVVDFWASWCPPCHAVNPVLEMLSQRHAGKTRFIQVNVDEDWGLGSEQGVQSIPTLIGFSKGKEVFRLIGLTEIRDNQENLLELFSR